MSEERLTSLSDSAIEWWSDAAGRERARRKLDILEAANLANGTPEGIRTVIAQLNADLERGLWRPPDMPLTEAEQIERIRAAQRMLGFNV